METFGFVMRVFNIVFGAFYFIPLLFVIKTQSRDSPQNLRFFAIFFFIMATLTGSYNLLHFRILPSTFFVTAAILILYVSAWLNYKQEKRKKDSVDGDK